MTFQKQQKHRKNIAWKKVIHILHREMVSVGIAVRISIPKMEEPDMAKKLTASRLKALEIT
jgi:hypothetical protein